MAMTACSTASAAPYRMEQMTSSIDGIEAGTVTLVTHVKQGKCNEVFFKCGLLTLVLATAITDVGSAFKAVVVVHWGLTPIVATVVSGLVFRVVVNIAVAVTVSAVVRHCI